MARITPVHNPHREALENATRYVREAETMDTSGQYPDRDVRLHFAHVWAMIAVATKGEENDQSRV